MTALNIAIALLCALGWLFTAVKWWAAEDWAKFEANMAAFWRDETLALQADRDRLAAELARLIDRDAQGRFVRKEPK